MSTSNWKQLNRTWKRPKPTPRWRARRLEARARASTGPSVESVLDVPYLMKCFDDCRTKGQAPGPDGWRYSDFGRQELSRALAAACDAIRRSAYRPPPPRVVEVPKTGGTRPLALNNVIDRVIAAGVLGAIRPAVELDLGPVTHSACGRGVHTLLRALYHAAEGGRFGVLANLDVKSAFPSLSVNVAMHAFRRSVKDRALLDLIDLLLRGAAGPQHHVGLPQGLALSPLALDASMSLYFDRYWSEHRDSLLVTRYVDNVPVLAADTHEGRRAVDRCRTLLGRIGLSLKDVPEREHLCDLRNGGVSQLLGFNLSLPRGSLKFDIGTGSLQKLRDNLTQAKREPNPPVTARSAVTGWVSAMAPAFDNARLDRITDQVTTVVRSNGFREISPDLVRCTWQRAGDKWRHFLRRHPRTETTRWSDSTV